MIKPDSLYRQGMKILGYTVEPKENADISGWRRVGSNIAYYRNCIQRNAGVYYHTLTFTIIPYGESMYIASDYPYKYSDLMNFIKENCDGSNYDRVRSTTLCKTLAGNLCSLLIITNFNSTPTEISRRSAVIFTARVHPG